MTSVQDKLLTLLINKYENSRTYEGTNKLNQSFGMKPTALMRGYYSDYADPDEISDFENSLKELEARGFIILDHKKNSRVISNIRLNEDKIEDIRGAVGRKDKNRAIADEIDYYERLKERSAGRDHGRCDDLPDKGIRSWFCEEETERLKAGKKARYERDEARRLIELAECIISNDRECLERELSIRFFGDSKVFEKQYRRRVCRLIGMYLEEMKGYETAKGVSDTESDRLLLEGYGIYKNPTYVYIKGDAVIEYNGGSRIETGKDMPIALSGALLDSIEKIKINASYIMTVENLTSFHGLSMDDRLLIYTGGYHGRAVKQLIRKIRRDNDKSGFLHFGDIDPDGFLILEHLNKSCMISAEPVYMGIAELERYRTYTKPLEGNDRIKAQNLISAGKYTEILSYMLEQNIKLEQEIVAQESRGQVP